jgi:uncharacterized protein involved in response to NO
MYEMIFGIGTAMNCGFFSNWFPELFPGTIPVVGKKLHFIVLWWVLEELVFGLWII